MKTSANQPWSEQQLYTLSIANKNACHQYLNLCEVASKTWIHSVLVVSLKWWMKYDEIWWHHINIQKNIYEITIQTITTVLASWANASCGDLFLANLQTAGKPSNGSSVSHLPKRSNHSYMARLWQPLFWNNFLVEHGATVFFSNHEHTKTFQNHELPSEGPQCDQIPWICYGLWGLPCWTSIKNPNRSRKL